MEKHNVWPPWTQVATARKPIPIVKAQGSYLYAADGRTYLDGISSWWVNLHGHTHPYIAEKIHAQAEVLEHVIFADFTHPPAEELAEKLVAMLPGNMSKIFYTDNGATAVEAALKMALQYWYNQDPDTPRKKVVCLKRSYHGDTLGAMSASGKSAFNKPFWAHLFDVESIDASLLGSQHLDSLLSKGDVACFIFEPLILGVGGMHIYSPEVLAALLSVCRSHGVLTIADEVMTGFGRTDTLFACDQIKEEPDIICLSKGLTGGFLPLGVTACKQHIFNAFYSDKMSHAFLHGHSYTANPLACSSAIASIELLLEERCEMARLRIASSHMAFCAEWQSHPKLKRCECIGTILVLEYHSEESSSYFNSLRNQLYHFFLDRGILLRPFGNILHVLPPYCITPEELQYIYDQIIFTLENT